MGDSLTLQLFERLACFTGVEWSDWGSKENADDCLMQEKQISAFNGGSIADLIHTPGLWAYANSTTALRDLFILLTSWVWKSSKNY